MTQPLRDHAERETIRTALDENLVVLAGAGAGKTYALVERLVCTLRAGKAAPSEMAAITFTRKAAGEMRARLHARLRQEAEQSAGDERHRIREAQSHIDQCFIGTIHAFCGRILREWPAPVGLPPDFTEIEPREETRLNRVAWDRFIEARYQADDPRLHQLEALDVRPSDLYDFFVQRHAYREVPLKETNTPRPDLDHAVDAVHALMDEIEAHAPDVLPKGADPCMETVDRARHFLEHHGLHNDGDAVRLLDYFAGEPSVKVTYWGEHRDFATTLRDERLPDLDANILQPVLRQWRQFVYRHVVDLIEDAVAFYEALRTERGQLTFHDLLLKTAELLREHPSVRRTIQQRYRRLFVDEFQDTDPVQAEVVLYIAGDGTAGADWQTVVPRPGSLFLVGDAKQSIYRFRRADLDTFRFVGERIEATGGRVLHLNTSFRSLGAFCDWANAAFPDIFDLHDEAHQAAFGPLHKHRTDGADAHCVRTLTTEKIKYNRRAEIAEQEAERIARFIASAIAGRTPLNGTSQEAVLPERAQPGDFMILTHTKKMLPVYARALEALSVPYDLIGGSELGDSEEVQALVTMLEAVYTPENPVLLIAYLRGPLAGVGDDVLRRFKKEGGTFHMGAAVPAALPDEERGKLNRALGHLRAVARDLNAYAPGTALERLFDRLGLIPFAAAQSMGSSRAGNLIRLLELVRQWTSQGLGWSGIMDELRALVHDPDAGVPTMTLETGRTDVVRVMNVHQAKGLQARVVFLADPNDGRSINGRDPGKHVARMEGQPYLAMPVQRSHGAYSSTTIAEPEGWEDDQGEEARYHAAENDRLLYVAATRARNLLVVSQYAPKPNDGSWGALAPALEDVPELETGEAPPDQASSTALPDADALSDERAARFSHIRQPTYKQEHAMQEASSNAYETLVRALLSELVEGHVPDDAAAYVQRHAQGAACMEHEHTRALDALRRFQASDLYREVRAADAVRTRVPLSFPSVGLSGGYVDVAFRTKSAWTLVVYTGSTLHPFQAEKFFPFMERYATAWETCTGEPVSRVGRWSVDNSEAVMQDVVEAQ